MIPYKVYPPLSLGPFLIYPWGMMVALGFLIGGGIAFREARKQGFPPEAILDVFIIVLLGTVIGSRMLVVLEYWEHFFKNPLQMLTVWEGGMAFYGAFLLSLVLVLIYLKKKKINFWRAADIASPSLSIGLAIGRIGNFLSGHHLGKITTLPWGINYFGESRHPVTLYSSFNALILFLILWFLKSRMAKNQGTLFLIFLFWYSGTRFILDFLRNDDLPVADPRFFLGLTSAQYISLGIFLAAVLILVYNCRTLIYKKFK